MGTNQDVKELVAYLESDDVTVVRQVKQVIQENLYSSKDAWFLNSLFDLYLVRKSDQLLDILIGINDHKASQLFEKMNESLKQGLYSEICTLLAAIIRKQPSWLYKVIGTHFLSNFLKFLKTEEDVVLVMSGCYIISSMLPCVPSLISPYLGEIMVIFYKFASLLVNQSVAVPDILLLHLQIGVYTLFQRLYSMYPNTFVAFMKEHFAGQRQGDIVVNQVIKPMFNFVKFHPGLCVETVKTETDNSKWKLFQPHDVITECQKLSLDPLDTVREATYSVFPQPSIAGEGGTNATSSSAKYTSFVNFTPIEGGSTLKPPIEYHSGSNDTDGEKFNEKAFLHSQPLSSGFSPSELCGLSTPPHSRPQSPFESMEDSTAVTENSAQLSARLSLLETTQEASTSLLHDVSSSGIRNEDKGPSEDRAPLLMQRSPSVDTSPVFQRGGQAGKAVAADSSARRHGRLLHMALAPAVSPETFEELDRGYHSVPATPTQILSRPKPLGKDDHCYTQSPHLGIKNLVEPKRVSPLFSNEFRKRDSHSYVDLEDAKGNRLNSTTGSSSYDHLVDPGFTPIKTSPGGSRDGSPQVEVHQNIPIALIHAIQELHRGGFSRANMETRRASLETSESSGENQRLKSRSPMEILDEFIECGANVYSLELSQIPLTSQLDTDWTYFGGNTPADESSILKTQLKLMHLQLQYERHKCELQVLRNRRLVGKLRKAQDTADELSIMNNKVQLLESEQSGDRTSLRKREEENRAIRSILKTSEEYYASTIQTMQEDREKLKYEIGEFSDQNSLLEEKLLSLKEELREKSMSLLESESEIKSLKAQLVMNTDVKLKAENLAKELLTQHDRFEHFREKFKTLSIYCNQSDEKEIIVQTLKTENAALLEERQILSSSLDAAKIRVQDLEVALGRKEIAVREHKNDMDSLRQQHSCEIKALESKHKSLTRASQALEAYVMQLYAKLEESGRHLHLSHSHAAPAVEDRSRAKDSTGDSSSYAARKLHKDSKGASSRAEQEGTDSRGSDSVCDSGIVE